VNALLGHLAAEKVVQVSTGHNIFETPSTIIDSGQNNKTTLLQMHLSVVLMLLVRKNYYRERSSIHYDSFGVIQDILTVKVVGVCLDKNAGLANLCKLLVYPHYKAQVEHYMNILAHVLFAPPKTKMCRTTRVKNNTYLAQKQL